MASEQEIAVTVTLPPMAIGGGFVPDESAQEMRGLLAAGLAPVKRPAVWTPPLPEELGRAVGTQFVVLEMVAQGGMGAVYKVKHLTLDKLMALKILSPDLAADEEFIQRFYGEAKVLAHLEHPNLVRLYDCKEAGGWHYFTMDFLQGQTLRDMLRNGALGEDEALALFLQICSAVRCAHESGVIHRDLKPENIMVMQGDKPLVKVLDFGIARATRHTSLVTEVSLQMGTPFYSAPEQFIGGTDERSDVFSLGVILHEMLTGKRPGDSARENMTNPQLDMVVKRCCQPEPGKRYSKVEDIESTVNLIVQTPALKRERRRNQLLLALLSFAILGLAAAAIAWSYARRKEHEANKTRAGAEVLVNSMLGELRDQMEAVGRLDLLEKLIRAAHDYFEGLPDDLRDAPSEWKRAWMWKYLGDVLQKQGREAEAHPCYARHMELLQELAQSHPQDATYQRHYAQSLGDMGRVWERQGDYDKALNSYQDQLVLLKDRATASTRDKEDVTALAASWENLGHLQRRLGRADDAEFSFRQQVKLFEDLQTKEELDMEDVRNLAKSFGNLGDVLTEGGGVDKAVEYHLKQKDLFDDLYANHLEDMRLLLELAISWNKLGKDFLLHDDLEKARVSFQQFHDKMKHLSLNVDSRRPDYRRSLATSHANLGDVAVKEKDWSAAAIYYLEDLRLTRELVDEFPEEQLYRHDLVFSLTNLARMNRLRGSGDEAVPLIKEAHEVVAKLEGGKADPAALQRLKQRIEEAAAARP